MIILRINNRELIVSNYKLHLLMQIWYAKLYSKGQNLVVYSTSREVESNQ